MYKFGKILNLKNVKYFWSLACLQKQIKAKLAYANADFRRFLIKHFAVMRKRLKIYSN